jgi:hypothetical protein
LPKLIQENGCYMKPKLKMLTFKFFIDNKKAQVLLDIEPKDEEKRKIYFEKIESLQSILLEDHLPEAILERNYSFRNRKNNQSGLGRN